MKNIIIYGAPAAGKGTQCEMLSEKYGYKHISMGQIFRDLDDSTEFNRKIKETISKGILIDDDTAIRLIKDKLDSISGDHIILDGFPRTMNQVNKLDEFFKDYIVINIDVDYEVAKERTLGRLNCSNCNKIYNIYDPERTPKNENICDICGTELSRRSDDNEESFKKRFDIYMQNVEDILNFYKNKDLLYIIKNNNSNEVFSDIEKVIK